MNSLTKNPTRVALSDRGLSALRPFCMMNQPIVLSLKRLPLAIFIFVQRAENARRRLVSALAFSTVFLAVVAPAGAATAISATARREAEAFYQSAYVAYQAADYAKSLSLLDSAEALRPEFADCLNLRGIICLKQGAYDRAESAFSHAVALDATLWAAQFNLGEIPFRKKEYPLAQARFEKLLSHTNRFKQRSQWELVQYKAYLCSLLAGDEAGTQKKLERLPAKDGATPALQYAQAALALSKKDNAGATKWLTAGQAGYNAALNRLFADSLNTAGWTAAPLAGPALALARQAGDPRRPLSASAYLDPRLEAAAAEPLPDADGGILPMLPRGPHLGFSLLPERTMPLAHQPVTDVPPAPAPMASPSRAGLDGGGLLLLE